MSCFAKCDSGSAKPYAAKAPRRRAATHDKVARAIAPASSPLHPRAPLRFLAPQRRAANTAHHTARNKICASHAHIPAAPMVSGPPLRRGGRSCRPSGANGAGETTGDPIGQRHKQPQCALYQRPCGLMDKALVFGTKDCRFESCQGHEYCSDSRWLSVLLDHTHTQCMGLQGEVRPLPLQVCHPSVRPTRVRRHTTLSCIIVPQHWGHLQLRGTTATACKNDTLTAVGFEPTQLALVELESTPLDHSGKLSCSAARS